METKPQLKDLNLQKVKLEPKGGLQAVYQLTEVVKGEPTITDYQVNVARDIHPDLQKLFKDLRSIVGRVLGLTSFLTITDGKELGLTDTKKEIARKYAEGLLQKIDVRGLSWSGSDENAGIIIPASMKLPMALKPVSIPRVLRLHNLHSALRKSWKRLPMQSKRKSMSSCLTASKRS